MIQWRDAAPTHAPPIAAFLRGHEQENPGLIVSVGGGRPHKKVLESGTERLLMHPTSRGRPLVQVAVEGSRWPSCIKGVLVLVPHWCAFLGDWYYCVLSFALSDELRFRSTGKRDVLPPVDKLGHTKTCAF
jgi:hypothetical protein